MLVYLPLQFPDSCSACGGRFEPREEHLGVLVALGAPQGLAAELGALCRAEAYHIRHAPPPGSPACILGRPEGAQGRQPLYGPQHFVLVAELYRDAAAEGSPTRAVAEALSVSRSTAAKWVAEARRRGHLPPTQRGIARA